MLLTERRLIWRRWARRADTRLVLAHFAHHRPHAGARKHRLPEAAGQAAGESGRRHRRRAPPAERHGLGHANPVARALGLVGVLRLQGREAHACTALLFQLFGLYSAPARSWAGAHR